MRSRAQIGYRNQSAGKQAEQIAMVLLRVMGIEMVEKIATPHIVTRDRDNQQKIIYTTKVSGDVRGILPGGRRVLCESKSPDRNLRRSDFKDHQLAALTENHEWGGLSLVAWSHSRGILILKWPIPGFDKKRASISFEDAEQIAWTKALS